LLAKTPFPPTGTRGPPCSGRVIAHPRRCRVGLRPGRCGERSRTTGERRLATPFPLRGRVLPGRFLLLNPREDLALVEAEERSLIAADLVHEDVVVAGALELLDRFAVSLGVRAARDGLGHVVG
jgi:hypothetical protein